MKLKNILYMFCTDTLLKFRTTNQDQYFCECCAEDITLLDKTIQNCEVVSVVPKDDYFEVILAAESANLPRNEKVYFRVTSMNANGYSEGFVKMTLEQAEFINKCTDIDNWIFRDVNFPYYRFRVDTSVWRFVDEVEGGKVNETEKHS